ncbi:DapH/DapD/GlmU-related protein [Nanoarchaeota archaeon]
MKQNRENEKLSFKAKLVVGLTYYSPFAFWKKLIYRIAGAKIGKNVGIGPGSQIISNNYDKILIKDGVSISAGVMVSAEDLVIGQGSYIGYQTLMTGKKIRIGKNCNINNRVFIDAYYAPVTIEDEVVVAGSVMLTSHDGSMMNVHGGKMVAKPVVLKKKSFIGNNAVVLPGVTVGEKGIVGAGGVVTKDVPMRTIVVGVPAKKLRTVR